MRGKIYAPILHPDFASLPVAHGASRFDLIAPHLEFPGGSVLDIGTHWGYVAHRLEDMGYAVTAVESSRQHLFFLKEIRELCDRRFTIYEGSVFELDNPRYDIVIALNVFHHFLKTRKRFDELEKFLKRLDTKVMILQVHSRGEKQMETAFRNLHPEEFARFIGETAGLPHVRSIGRYAKRELFKLTRDQATTLPNFPSSNKVPT